MIGGNLGAAIQMLKVMNQQGGGGQSWESYWASQPEVLFFGLYSDIAGGQMPNRKTGSSDYLTVAGSAGSETYQCPNTAPYIAADTDYIWFKTDASQRTVTTAELIGYDLQRTPVKYANDTPYAISAIMILKSGEVLSSVKLDKLHTDMSLYAWWSGVLNENGFLKENRTGQSLWTPEALFDAASVNLFDRLTAKSEEPANDRKVLIDTCIKALKAADLFDTQFDVFVVTRGTGLATTKENWIKDADHATGVPNGGTLTYAEDVGYNSDGTKSYINTNFIASSDGSLFKKDDACFIFKVSGTSSTTSMHGVYNVDVGCVNLSKSGYARLNSMVATASTVGAYITGYNCISRDDALEVDIYRDENANTYSVVSTAIPSISAFILTANIENVPTYFAKNTEIIEFYAFGKALTQAKFNTLRVIMNTYIAGL